MAARQITRVRIRIPEPEWEVFKNMWTEALKPHRLPRGRQPPPPPAGLVIIDEGGSAFVEPRLRPLLQVTEEELDDLHQIVNPGSRRRREWEYPCPGLVVCPDQLGHYWKIALAAIAAGFLLYFAARALRRRWAGRLNQEDIGGPPPGPQGGRGGGVLAHDGLIGVAGMSAAGQMLVIRAGMVALITLVPARRRRSLGGGHGGGGLLDLLAGVNAAGLVGRALGVVLVVPPPRRVLASTSSTAAGTMEDAGPSSPRSAAATKEAFDDLVDGAVRTVRRAAVGMLWRRARPDADVERMLELIVQLRAWRSITVPEDHTSKDEAVDTNEEKSNGDGADTENHS